MWKVILLLAALFGAALYFPQTRPRVLEALEPVLDPVLTWSTKGEMRKIVRDLETVEEQGYDLPHNQEHFRAWIARRYTGDESGMDAWKNTYRLVERRDHFELVSYGPDGEAGTGDDIRIRGERIGSGR